MKPVSTTRQGFTLIEMAVVLTIVGLLAGGVTIGTVIIRGAELRSITTDLNRYTAAIQNFRTKFNAVPGDMTNAYSYWGAAAGCTASAVVTIGDTGCNGDGDGKINDWFNEGKRAWWMLVQAGFIEGNYPATAISYTSVAGTDLPGSKVNGVYALLTKQISAYAGWGSYSDYGTWITLGTTSSNAPFNGVLRPEDALSIDGKMDDGHPGSGRFVAGDGAISSGVYDNRCVTARTAVGSYDTTNSGLNCVITYNMP